MRLVVFPAFVVVLASTLACSWARGSEALRPIGRVTAAFGVASITSPAGERPGDLHSFINSGDRIQTNGGGVTILLASRVVLKIDHDTTITVNESPDHLHVVLERGTLHTYVGRRPLAAGPVCVQDPYTRAETSSGVFLASYDPGTRVGYYACEHASIDVESSTGKTVKLDADKQVELENGIVLSVAGIDRMAFNQRKQSLERLGQVAREHGTQTFRQRTRLWDTQLALSQLAAAGWIDPRTLQTSASSTKKPTKKNKKSTSNGSSTETPQEMGPEDDGTRQPIENPVSETPVARRDETNLPAEPQNPPIELGDIRPIPRRPVGDPTGADSQPVVADPPPIAMPTDPPVAAQIELPAIPPSHTRPVTGGDATNDAPARRIELADRPLTPPANLPSEIGLPVGGAPPIRARVGETGFDPAEAPSQPVLPRDRGVIRDRVAEIAPAAPAPRIDLNLVGDAMLPRGDTPAIPRVAQNVPVAITAPVPRIGIETAPGAPAVPTLIDGPPAVLPGNGINPANPVAPTAVSAPVRADLGIGSPQQTIPRLDPGGGPITAPTPVPAPTPAPIGSIDITAPIVNPIQVAPPPADLSLGTIADPTVTPTIAPQLPAITAPTLTAPVTGTTSTSITLQNPLLPSADGATAVPVPTPIVGPAPLPTPTEVAPTTATPPTGTTGTKTSPTGSKNTTTVAPAPAPAPGS